MKISKGTQPDECYVEIITFSEMYFCHANVNILQDGIRYSDIRKANEKHIIGKQSEHDLIIIMRSIYLQYAKTFALLMP